MPHIPTIMFLVIGLGWLALGIRAAIGLRKLPNLGKIQPSLTGSFPHVSIVFAARDEAEKLPAALASMAALDYPNYDIIAADDRSADVTGKILDDFAAQNPRVTAMHIAELPPGWLGKPYALEEAARRATGEWLVFTDADVVFMPGVLGRALALAERERWDHLTLLAEVEMRGFLEKVALGFFALCFILGNRIWRVSDPGSKSYAGVGAFQLVRRSAYEASGTHRRLALEVLDDMKLGKIIKDSGFRSGVAACDGLVRVRWQDGIGNIVRGVTKNMFAALNFHIYLALVAVGLILVSSVLPLAGALFAHGPIRVAAAFAALIPAVLQGILIHEMGESRFYGLTYPLGALLFVYMVLRSMVVTLAQGGVVWRETFYPIDELRRGIV